MRAAFGEIREQHDRIDVLVNNAGIAVDGPDHRPLAPDHERARRTLETNFPRRLALLRRSCPVDA